MADLFDRILQDLKELQLGAELEDEEAALLAEAMDNITTVWEEVLDRQVVDRDIGANRRLLSGLPPNERPN